MVYNNYKQRLEAQDTFTFTIININIIPPFQKKKKL